MGRSRGGLTSKIHAVVDANGAPRAHTRRGSRQPVMFGFTQRIAATNDVTGRSRLMTRTGSEHSSASKARGQTYRPSGIARRQSALAPISQKWPSRLQHELLADVRFGSKADMCSAKRDVRFTPNSDRESGFSPLSALPPKADMCGALADVR
jgi:hypothetical protein